MNRRKAEAKALYRHKCKVSYAKAIARCEREIASLGDRDDLEARITRRACLALACPPGVVGAIMRDHYLARLSNLRDQAARDEA